MQHAGRDPHELLDDDGITALHHAAQNDFAEIAEILLNFGADPLYKSEEGLTPYEVTMIHHSDRVKQLFERHA